MKLEITYTHQDPILHKYSSGSSSKLTIDTWELDKILLVLDSLPFIKRIDFHELSLDRFSSYKQMKVLEYINNRFQQMNESDDEFETI